MAASFATEDDPLLNLRVAAAGNANPVLAKNDEPSTADDVAHDITEGRFLRFAAPGGHRSFPLDAETRFIVDEKPIDLRTIYVAWLNRDATLAEYRGAVQTLNEALSRAGSNAQIQNLPVPARLDLLSWLRAEQEESDYIEPLDAKAAVAQADGSAAVAAGTDGGISSVPTAQVLQARGQKTIDARLAEIYRGERKMGHGDRNGVLRGIKPTDFSHVRKTAEVFVGRRSRAAGPNGPTPSASLVPSNNPALVSSRSKPSTAAGGAPKRLEPIILLSPSASSLLRINNIKSFLGDGIFIPASHESVQGNTASILNISRSMPSIDGRSSLRFVLVDSPDQFKPDYWSRVVAVLTTGQKWQFSSYKWTQPDELFKHALGIYVGYAGEQLPDTVRGWGRSVRIHLIDKWAPNQGDKGRWRDREVVESIWTEIEEWMRSRGWGRDGFGR